MGGNPQQLGSRPSGHAYHPRTAPTHRRRKGGVHLLAQLQQAVGGGGADQPRAHACGGVGRLAGRGRGGVSPPPSHSRRRCPPRPCCPPRTDEGKHGALVPKVDQAGAQAEAGLEHVACGRAPAAQEVLAKHLLHESGGGGAAGARRHGRQQVHEGEVDDGADLGTHVGGGR